MEVERKTAGLQTATNFWGTSATAFYNQELRCDLKTLLKIIVVERRMIGEVQNETDGCLALS